MPPQNFPGYNPGRRVGPPMPPAGLSASRTLASSVQGGDNVQVYSKVIKHWINGVAAAGRQQFFVGIPPTLVGGAGANGNWIGPKQLSAYPVDINGLAVGIKVPGSVDFASVIKGVSDNGFVRVNFKDKQLPWESIHFKPQGAGPYGPLATAVGVESYATASIPMPVLGATRYQHGLGFRVSPTGTPFWVEVNLTVAPLAACSVGVILYVTEYAPLA